MVCGQRVGVWGDHEVFMASCWEPEGHQWECYDDHLQLRWTPGKGVDSSGRCALIDPADLPFDEGAAAAFDAFTMAPLPGRDTRSGRRPRSRS